MREGSEKEPPELSLAEEDVFGDNEEEAPAAAEAPVAAQKKDDGDDDDDGDYECEDDEEEQDEDDEEAAPCGLEDSSEDESYVPPGSQGDMSDEDGYVKMSDEDVAKTEEDEEKSFVLGRLGLQGRLLARRRRKEVLDALYKALQTSPGDVASGQLAAVLQSRPKALLFKDGLGRTALHLSLLRSRPDLVKTLLAVEDVGLVARAVATHFQAAGQKGKDCLPCLHLALSGVPFEQALASSLECLRLLLAVPGVRVQQVDNSGRSALHMACAFGCTAAVDLLLEKGSDPGLTDDLGCMALHYAIDSRSTACVQRMLEASEPSLFAAELHPFYRCIDRQAWEAALLLHKRGWPIPEADINRLFDFAAARGLTTEWNFVCEKGVDSSSRLEDVVWDEKVFGPVSTAVVTHPLCLSHGAMPLDADDPTLRHKMISKTPENPHRLEVLCGDRGLLRAEAFRELRWLSEPSPAPLVDLLRVHEFWYLHKLQQRVREAGNGGPLQRVPLDGGDTKVTEESWAASLRACGCVLEAVDQVCNEQVRNAFCAVRPPGHHLGPAGAVNKKDLDDDPEGSQGFCLVNNVAVGAAYARCVYRHVIHRVAIVDFDVHHGNGTEAIVRNLRYRETQSKARDLSLSHAGFSARISVAAPPSCKPWLDPESDTDNVFFASIHGYGSGFYPGSGATSSQSKPRIINAALHSDSSSADFREGMRTQVLPQLQAFDPDMIFVSAGFDGHEDDLIGICRNVEEDYIWATQQLLAVANRCCQGRLVSVLEGGYNTRAEVLSPFALSVASHVRTLMHTSQNYSFLDFEAPCAPSDPSSGDKSKALLEADRRRVARRAEARRLRLKRRFAGAGDLAEVPEKVAKVAPEGATAEGAAAEAGSVPPEGSPEWPPEEAPAGEAVEAIQEAPAEESNSAEAAFAEAACSQDADGSFQEAPEGALEGGAAHATVEGASEVAAEFTGQDPSAESAQDIGVDFAEDASDGTPREVPDELI